MRSVLTYLLGPFIALLPTSRAKPAAERLEIDLTRAAVMSGVVETILCALLLVVWYFAFSKSFTEQHIAAFMRSNPRNPQDIVMFSYGLSTVLILTYFTHPVTLTLVYFGMEGLLRSFAGLLAEEQLGTLPLLLLEFAGQKIHRKAVKMIEGPPVADVVTRSGEKDDWQLRIESCRLRRWDQLTTIRYQDRLYVLAAKFEGTPPRPFIYVLRDLPPNRVVRGVYDYSPDEVFRPDFEKSQTWKV